jgi:putative acyl-CoA dehydrogenase
MMRAVLADLGLEVEGAVALIMRLARAFDHAASDPREAAYARLVTPAAKYWICKTAPSFIYEAMECLGGNGYVEESVLPRLYREAPVNAIWEGSGNVMCLDVLRALRRDKEAAELFAELEREGSRLSGTETPLFEPMDEFSTEAVARVTVGKLASLAATVALSASTPAPVVDAFVRTRLLSPHSALYGADHLDARTAETLLQRALPEI